MQRSTIFKLTFWILVFAQLGGLIIVWTLARSITDPENEDRGIFSSKSNAINPRGFTDPIGDIGSGVTKVVSVATEVPAKVSSVVAAVETEVAKYLSFELDAGTRHVSVQVAGKTIPIWPPSGAIKIPDLPLSEKQQEPIKSIVDKFNQALSFDLGTIVSLMILVAILSTCAVVGLGIELHLCWGMVVWFALVLMGIMSSVAACSLFWFLYHSLDVIVSAAREQNLTVDRGPAIKKAWDTFIWSALQGGVSILLCFLSVAHKIIGRQRKPHGEDTKHSELDSKSPEMVENTHEIAPAATTYETVTKPEETYPKTLSRYDGVGAPIRLRVDPNAGGQNIVQVI